MKKTLASFGALAVITIFLGPQDAITAKPSKEVMHTTYNKLPLSIRKAEGALLQQAAVNAMDLSYQVRQAHWTLKGETFLPVHQFFDTLQAELHEFIDILAERQMQLGGTIYGTLRVAAGTSTLPEYPLDLVKVKDHVQAICKVLSAYAELCRTNIRVCQDLGDDVTSEIFVTITRALDKQLWLLESNLEPDMIPKN